MRNSNQSVLNSFIIEVQLINPITKIVSQLENKEFRDCDIKWLDSKLEGFINLTCQTLGVQTSIVSKSESVSPKYMGGYAIEYYTKYFNMLLDYFKIF